MNFFPVIIKTQHVTEIREYIEKVHRVSMYKAYITYADKFGHNKISHWDVMCTYLWHFHRDEYSWHIDESTGVLDPGLSRKNATADMLVPKAHIAVHTRYQLYKTSLALLLRTGYCASPASRALSSASLLPVWADCSNVTDHDEAALVTYMHSFEYARTDLAFKFDGLLDAYRKRKARVAACSHDWRFEYLNETYLESALRSGNFYYPDTEPHWLKMFSKHY